MLGMLTVAFVIEPRAGLLLLLAVVAGTSVLVRLRSAAVPARELEREANAILYGDLEERLGGLEDLRANGAGRYAVHRLHANSAHSWTAARRAALLGDGSYAFAAVTFSVGSVATLALGFILHDRGLVTVGQVVALFRYSEMMRQPLERISEQLKEFQKALAGARRAAVLLATAPAVGDGPLGPEALPPGALSVDFENVTFAYHPGSAPAVRDINLHIAPGTHVGVVGRTGSGKTTLGRLLLRLWDVDQGAVRLGGVDVRQLRPSVLRDRVAVVTQDVELFDASVRDNLTLFRTRAATDDVLVTVLRDVGLGRWLAGQEHGLDTVLRGQTTVSAGEAQLLAFARAFIADPDVVVLDEASSRLDPATEEAVAAATAALLRGRTALIVAHRLATLDRVDDIVVVEQGQILEHARRCQLANDPSSRYARLVRASRLTARFEEAG